MFRPGFCMPLQCTNDHVVKIKRSLLKQKSTDFIKISKSKQARTVKTINYLDLSSHCSKVIDFGQRHEKKGRPPQKKVLKSKSLKNEKHKGQKRKEVCCQTENKLAKKEEIYETEVNLPDIHATTETVLDKEQWEKRKKSIQAKLLLRRENLLTKDEEQDIHMRADVYAITTIPDDDFYVLPQFDSLPRAPVPVEEITIDTTYPAARKKRRRNYGSANCYVNDHNEEDVYDNTRMLPIGTRLIKPPNKLVELVAQAIDGSPDGLLQVQQIYTYLQNRYPYFRYMERGAINSWRSSIRHALYQKWFRKIRFDLNYISCKGSYWTINHKSSPREWKMPPHACEHMVIGREECLIIDSLDMYNTAYRKIGRYLQEDHTSDDNMELVSAVQEYDSHVIHNSSLSQSSSEEIDVENHIPSPVKEPDPILATCAPDWISEDLYYLPKPDSNNIDILHPASLADTLLSPSLSSPVYSSPDEIGTDLQLGSPINSPVPPNFGILSTVDHKASKHCKKKTSPTKSGETENKKSCGPAVIEKPGNSNFDRVQLSPDKEITSSWEDCGTLVLSPTNSQASPKMYVFGYPLKLQNLELLKEINNDVDICNGDGRCETEFYSTFNNITGVLQSIKNCSSETCGSDESLSDTDVVAEFSKSSGHSSPSDLSDIMLMYA